MLALRRRRMAASHPFFRGGFRPFFFGATAWAVIAMALWVATLAGALALPAAIDPLAWHRHEMLFGFAGAAVAGFLLTAVPNWTGRLPIAGWPLAALFGLWVAARAALLLSAFTGLLLAAILDVGFFLLLAALAAREVLEANNRNLPIVGMVLLFAAVNALDYFAMAGLVSAADVGWQLAIAILILLISLIGGRIVPSFTRNWLARRGVARLPTQPGRFDLLVIVATVLAMLAWIAGPQGIPTAAVILAAALLQLVRLARWKGYRTFRDPLVLILHVGYLWIPVGLALLGLSAAGVVPRSGAVHALTAGAMATMILAVMTRASLGHTGRELSASPGTSVAYVLLTAGAALRVAASLGAVDYSGGIEIAGLLWGSALVLFLVIYTPVLWRPRVGEQR